MNMAFVIEHADGAIYDPTTFSGGEVGDLTDVSVDAYGTVSYKFPAPARVLIRLSIRNGLMYRTLVDWKPRPAGNVNEYWDGFDQDQRETSLQSRKRMSCGRYGVLSALRICLKKERIMTEGENSCLERLKAAVRLANVAELSESSKQLDEAIFDQACFSDDTVKELFEIIGSDAYAQMADGVTLLKVFEYNLELLSESQSKDLQRSLVLFVPNARDAIAAFLAVEPIAELWKDGRSADALSVIRKSASSDETLVLVAHGFYWLAKKTTDVGVQKRCMVQLEELGRHPSPEVTVEAQAALNRLGAAG